MGVLHGNPFLLASGVPTEPTFPLQRSVRFRSGASPYFARTPSTAGNRKTWTWSGWVKRGILGSTQALFESGNASSIYTLLWFNSSDQLALLQDNGAGGVLTVTTAAVFRDPSAWYHVVMAVDTTQTVSNNRTILYINGINQTLTYTTQLAKDADTWVNFTYQHRLGGRTGNSSYLDGYLTEVNFIDGQALTPLSFGGYNPGTNVWEPRAYTGTYGTNGFYLPFKDNSKVEALGYSSSISSAELITNSTFTTNVTGWTSRNGTALTWQTGSLARMSNTGSAACMAYLTIPTVVGQTYYVQTHIPTVSLGAAGRNVGVYKSDDQALAVNPVFVASGTVAGAYQGTFTATATTTYITMFGDTYGTGSCDFSVVSVSAAGYKNNWKPFNISLTSGPTYDSMLDVPTITSSNNANFAVLNPLDIIGTGGSITSGNLQLTGGTGAWYQSRSAFALTTGKWYWEITIVSTNVSSNGIDLGIANSSTQLAGYGQANKWIYNNNSGGRKSLNGTSSAYGTAFLTNNVVGVAFDADLGTLEFYINGSTQGVAASTGLPNPAFPIVECYGTDSVAINFGQRPFSYTPPSGFKSLNTFNLPEPTIPRGDKYFKQYLYTGNGGGLQVGEIQKPMSLFNLDRSLRFRSSNSAYLSRTPASAGNRKTWTWSAWVKRGTLGGNPTLFANNFSGSGGLHYIQFATDTIFMYAELSTGIKTSWATTAVFKDPNMWYHVVVVFDTTQSAVANMGKVYVNGVQQTTVINNYSASYISQNADGWINASGYAHYVGSGRAYYTNQDFDGYLADIYFVDGQSLTPTSFGQYDGNNYWTPKAYTGTYGTNGFHLEFEDYSGTTASTIGKDTSGNSNNWTPSGINLTAPADTNAAWDSMVDVPTLTSTDTANFATLNPLNIFGVNGAAGTVSNANLRTQSAASVNAYHYCASTISVSEGKYYFEATLTQVAGSIYPTACAGFVINNTSAALPGTYVQVQGYTGSGSAILVNGTTVQSGLATVTSGDVIGVAFDATNLTCQFYKNGALFGTLVTGLTSATYQAMVVPISNASSATSIIDVNFGQRPFKYSNYGVDRPAATFKALNSFNVAEVVGDVETPDLVRIKSRSATTPAMWFNSVSGEGKYILGNNNTAAEATDVNSLIQFNKNGLLIGNNANINTLSATYVADVWKAGSSTVTNNAGSITSQVRANPISGISVVSFTYVTGTSTIGHGLSTTPKFIIVKRKDSTGDWYVNHASLSSTNNNYLLLNSTATQGTASWGGSPSATTFSVSGNILAPGNYIAYCFAEIDGFSKFGSYVSNADPNGPFVYTGFRPRWVMIKQRDAIRSWIMYDTTRSTYNIVDKYFFMEGLNNNEQTAALLDITSNGFKHRSNNVNTNTTAGQVYIYMAFAENPFKYALAR